MHKISLHFRPVLFAALFSAVAVVAQQGAATPAAPVPSAIRSAQKIFVSNGGADSRLFGKVRFSFEGDTNRTYNQFYAALNATGHYKLVDDPTDANMVLESRLYLPPQTVSIVKDSPIRRCNWSFMTLRRTMSCGR